MGQHQQMVMVPDLNSLQNLVHWRQSCSHSIVIYQRLLHQVVKNLPTNAGDVGWIPDGRSPEVGNGIPLQYSCLENSMDRVAW